MIFGDDRKKTHWGRVVVKSGKLAVIFCDSCAYHHLFPIPENTNDYYEGDHFYKEHSPIDWLDKEILEYERGSWNSAYKYQMERFDITKPLIDVGCSTGTFLDFWNKNGGRLSFGIEPSKLASDVAKNRYGINTISYDLFKEMSINLDFNVRMSLVLEHMPDPLDFIKMYTQNMKSGKLMIIVPNEFNPLQQRIGGNWFVSNVHINYFTPWSIRNLMEQAGFHIFHMSTTFPVELFAVAGYDYRGNDKRGRKVHNFRMSFERVFRTKAFGLYRSLFNRFGWGREIIIVGRK